MITILLQKILDIIKAYITSLNTKLNQIKDNLSELIIVKTAEGDIASFYTSLARPLQSAKFAIKATGGNGTPSSPIAINGFTGITVKHSGSDTSDYTSYPISWQTEAGTVYGGEIDITSGKLIVNYTLANLSDLSWENAEQSGKTIFFARVDDKINTVDNLAYCEIFASATTSGTSLANAASLLTNDFMICTSKNTVNPRIYVRADGYTSTQFANAILGYKVAYQLATPVSIQLTPEEITAFIGTNNIWGDTNGNATIKYLGKFQEVEPEENEEEEP